jgi:hypothetical protein
MALRGQGYETLTGHEARQMLSEEPDLIPVSTSCFQEQTSSLGAMNQEMDLRKPDSIDHDAIYPRQCEGHTDDG